MKKSFFIFLFIIYLSKIFSNNDNSNDINNDMSDDDLTIYEGKETTIFKTDEKTQQLKIISEEEISKINPNDFSELLTKAFNLDIINNGTTGNVSTVSIRGFNGGRILILIDGIPMNSVQSGSFDLSMISVNDIEEIQLIKGGSDTKYNFSGAIGGIINIITKKSKNAGFKIDSSFYNLFYYPGFYYVNPGTTDKKFSKIYDFFDTQNLKFGFNIGNKIVQFKINSEANRAYNHFLYKDQNDISRRRTDNEIWNIFVRSNIAFTLPYYMKLTFNGNYLYANKNIPGPVNSVDTGKEINNQSNVSVFFDADLVGNERIDTELTINYKFDNIEYYDLSYNSNHKINTINIINRWGFIAAKFLTVNIGGDFNYSYLDSTDLGNVLMFNGGGYLTLDFTILKTAKIIPSVKLIYFKEYPIAVPKLGFVFYLGKNFILKNNYYRTFKLPSLNDLYWTKDSFAEGNPDLKPEDGFGGDIILSYYKEKILYAETSIYINYIKDAILWQKSGKLWRPFNLGKAFYFGLDCEVKSDFSKYVELKGLYSLLITYALNDEFTFESDKRMPYCPIHSFGFGITFNWKKGNLNMTGNFKSERFTAVENVTKLDPYFTLDINFNQTIKIVTIFASIKNAFNFLYYLQEGYPMSGGSVIIGLKINYEKEFKKN